MIYHRGTLEEFNMWHTAVKVSEGITGEGRVGFIQGIPAPNNQRTVAYSVPIQHPNETDDYIWSYGDYEDTQKLSLSESGAKILGWLSE